MKCFLCGKETELKDTDYGDHRCPFCNVEVSIYNPNQPDWKPDNQTTEEKWLEEGEKPMGKLAERAREKSPYIKLDIGEETPELVYKAWKEATDNFGNETFRYIFEQNTETGSVTKQLDNRSQTFAEAMDKIAFGSKVILKREPKLDHEGEVVENKSIWTVKQIS